MHDLALAARNVWELRKRFGKEGLRRKKERERGDLLPPSLTSFSFSRDDAQLSSSFLVSRPMLVGPPRRPEAILAISRLPLSLSFLTHPGRPIQCMQRPSLVYYFSLSMAVRVLNEYSGAQLQGPRI